MSLRPAPFFLTEGTVAALIDGREGARLVNVPIVPLRLVNMPRRSEDPRLARGNDNGPDFLGAPRG